MQQDHREERQRAGDLGVEAVGRETSMEIVMEESPVGDHQANGFGEERAGPSPVLNAGVQDQQAS